MRVHWSPMVERFSIKFEGPGVENHTIDAGILASALLSLTELIEESQLAVDPDGPRYRVNITAMSEGSFAVTLELQQWIAAAIAFLASDSANAAVVLKTLFGGGGLFDLLKFLKGGKATGMTQIGDSLVVEVGDESREFQIGAGKLVMKRSVRKSVRKFVAPLGGSAISTLSVVLPDTEPLVIASDDRQALTAPLQDETITDTVVEMWLNVRTIRFDGTRWEFRNPSTAQVIRATILDEPFLDRVDRRQESFAQGDAMFCEVRVRQWETDDGKIEEDYSILKVLSHSSDTGIQGRFDS